MKLYVSSGVVNARKVRAVADLLGLEPELIWLDYFKGEVWSDAFAELNPNRMIPVLQDGDLILWESSAINKYLCSKVAGNTLYPADSKVQADIDRWVAWDLAHYNKFYSVICFETVVKGFLNQEVDSALVGWAVTNFAVNAGILDRHLEGREYIVGDHLTLADIAIGSGEFFADRIDFDWSGYPNLVAFYERMRQLPVLRKTAVPPEQMGSRPDGVTAFIAS